MRLFLDLLRASWPIALLAGLVGATSGAASVGLVALILRTLRESPGANGPAAGLFILLCAVVLLTRTAAQLLLSRLMQGSVSRLRARLCRRILASPLEHLEGVGAHRLLASLTQDVDIVAAVVNGLPGLGVNAVVIACGAVYLGSLSPVLLAGSVGFLALGVASYFLASRRAAVYVRRARESHDDVVRHVKELLDGVKELKMHAARRREFVDRLARAEAAESGSKYLGDCIQDAAINGGRLLFFVAIGLLLFVWPRLTPINPPTLTGYALTILYLSSPLEQIIGWVPFLGWALGAAAHLERLGLLLDGAGVEPEPGEAAGGPAGAAAAPWREIALAGVTHTYRTEGQPAGFVLGPVDLALRPGEVVFVVGGNGSGKTTLAKLVVGLYVPEAGEVRLDGRAIDPGSREAYRQLFTVVFDDPAVFDTLWGLAAPDLDRRAGDLLRRLGLEGVVTVTHGVFSTTKLSRGQRKRLALVIAYLEDRPIYVFDEWAADQDPGFRRLFYLELLPELRSRGRTVLAITHDDRYFGQADRILKVDEGHVAEAARQEAGQVPGEPGSRSATGSA